MFQPMGQIGFKLKSAPGHDLKSQKHVLSCSLTLFPDVRKNPTFSEATSDEVVLKIVILNQGGAGKLHFQAR